MNSIDPEKGRKSDSDSSLAAGTGHFAAVTETSMVMRAQSRFENLKGC